MLDFLLIAFSFLLTIVQAIHSIEKKRYKQKTGFRSTTKKVLAQFQLNPPGSKWYLPNTLDVENSMIEIWKNRKCTDLLSDIYC
jgi:hypothetical protein